MSARVFRAVCLAFLVSVLMNNAPVTTHAQTDEPTPTPLPERSHDSRLKQAQKKEGIEAHRTRLNNAKEAYRLSRETERAEQTLAQRQERAKTAITVALRHLEVLQQRIETSSLLETEKEDLLTTIQTTQQEFEALLDAVDRASTIEEVQQVITTVKEQWASHRTLGEEYRSTLRQNRITLLATKLTALANRIENVLTTIPSDTNTSSAQEALSAAYAYLAQVEGSEGDESKTLLSNAKESLRQAIAEIKVLRHTPEEE